MKRISSVALAALIAVQVAPSFGAADQGFFGQGLSTLKGYMPESKLAQGGIGLLGTIALLAFLAQFYKPTRKFTRALPGKAWGGLKWMGGGIKHGYKSIAPEKIGGYTSESGPLTPSTVAD